MLAEPTRADRLPERPPEHTAATAAARPKAGNGISPHGGSGLSAGARCRTSSTDTPFCRWRSSWNGWPRGPIHRNPGLVVCGIDNLRLFKGVIIGESAGGHGRDPRGQGRPRRRSFHRTRRAQRHAAPAAARSPMHEPTSSWPTGTSRPRAAVPRASFSPTRYRATRSIRPSCFTGRPCRESSGSTASASARSRAGSPPRQRPAEWLEQPLRNVWLTDPLAIDCAFQLVVLWCRDRLGANSLPTAIGGYRQFRRAFPAEGVRVVAQIRHASDTRAVADIEFLDAQGELVARLDCYECVVDASLNQAFRRTKLQRVSHYHQPSDLRICPARASLSYDGG